MTVSSKTWKRTTEKWYWYSLEVLPPAIMRGGAFLLGEAETHRTCQITGEMRAAYSAFRECPTGTFWTARQAMTVPEFLEAIKVVA